MRNGMFYYVWSVPGAQLPADISYPMGMAMNIPCVGMCMHYSTGTYILRTWASH